MQQPCIVQRNQPCMLLGNGKQGLIIISRINNGAVQPDGELINPCLSDQGCKLRLPAISLDFLRSGFQKSPHLGQLFLVNFGNAEFDVNNLLLKGRSIRGIVEGDSVPQVFIPQLLELHRQGRSPLINWSSSTRLPTSIRRLKTVKAV